MNRIIVSILITSLISITNINLYTNIEDNDKYINIIKELYATLENANNDIKSLNKLIKKQQIRTLTNKKQYKRNIILLNKQIDRLLKEKQLWIQQYKNITTKRKHKIMQLYAIAKVNHTQLTPIIQMHIEPIENFKIIAEIGFSYEFDSSNIKAKYNVGLAYMFFGI